MLPTAPGMAFLAVSAAAGAAAGLAASAGLAPAAGAVAAGAAAAPAAGAAAAARRSRLGRRDGRGRIHVGAQEGDQVDAVFGTAEAREGHLGAGDIGARRLQELEQLVIGPGAALGLHGRGIGEARNGRARTIHHAEQRRADLDGLGGGGVVAGLALGGRHLALCRVGLGQDRAPVGQGFFDRRGRTTGGIFHHAFDDIAGLGRLLGFIDRFGDDAHDKDEDCRAQDRTNDLVPLKGIHCGQAPQRRCPGEARARRSDRVSPAEIRGDITRRRLAVIAAKRRIKRKR